MTVRHGPAAAVDMRVALGEAWGVLSVLLKLGRPAHQDLALSGLDNQLSFQRSHDHGVLKLKRKCPARFRPKVRQYAVSANGSAHGSCGQHHSRRLRKSECPACADGLQDPAKAPISEARLSSIQTHSANRAGSISPLSLLVRCRLRPERAF